MDLFDIETGSHQFTTDFFHGLFTAAEDQCIFIRCFAEQFFEQGHFLRLVYDKGFLYDLLRWFGDGDIDSTQINPTHAYSLPGTYTIKLTVVSPTYCDSSYEKSIFVIESPQAQFSTTNVCLHNQSTFNDLSTPVIGSSITGWNWNFGDGDSSSTQNNSHLYQNAGNYTVLLTITSKEGCYDTISSVVSVYNLPSVNFTNSKACTNSPIQFNDSTTCTSGFPSNWLWDFGTGIQSTLQNPAYTYANAFAYPIKLVVSSNYGCLDSLTKFIIINQSPQFNINANDNCFNTTTNFQSIPVQGSSTNVGYIWNLGDSSYSTNPNPQHIYNAPGSYNINLTVTNLGNSCSTNISDTVKINPLPKAKFLSDSACVNTNLQLTDLSTINGGIINNYKWTIGSYGTSNLQNPIINLAAADSFAVKLLVTSNTRSVLFLKPMIPNTFMYLFIKTLFCGLNKFNNDEEHLIESLVKAYISIKDLSQDFFGLRDFYSLIKNVAKNLNDKKNKF